MLVTKPHRNSSLERDGSRGSSVAGSPRTCSITERYPVSIGCCDTSATFRNIGARRDLTNAARSAKTNLSRRVPTVRCACASQTEHCSHSGIGRDDNEERVMAVDKDVLEMLRTETVHRPRPRLAEAGYGLGCQVGAGPEGSHAR